MWPLVWLPIWLHKCVQVDTALGIAIGRQMVNNCLSSRACQGIRHQVSKGNQIWGLKEIECFFHLFPFCLNMVVVQSLSRVQIFATPWTPACWTSLPFTISHSLLKLMFIDLVMPSNHLIFCPLLFLLSSIFLSIRVFSNELAFCIRWPIIGTSASVLPMNIQGWFPLGLTGLISLLSKGLSRIFSSTTVWKHQFFGTQPSLWFQLSRICISGAGMMARGGICGFGIFGCWIT